MISPNVPSSSWSINKPVAVTWRYRLKMLWFFEVMFSQTLQSEASRIPLLIEEAMA